MCCFPEDVMRRIISYIQQPLPSVDQVDVTWKELNQKDLSTMMRVSRVTYSIAAPLLYKEVVVNNLSSFFLGVDDSIQPQHQACTTHSSTQSPLCGYIIKKDGTTYDCPRHISSHNQTATTFKGHVSTAFAMFHKQELLAKVEALHFVYSTADKYIFTGIDIDTSQPGPLPDSILSGQCDTRRYKNVPKWVENLQFSFNPLVNLTRATIGRWMGKAWNENTFFKSGLWEFQCESDLEVAMGKFEYHLAGDMPQIAPRLVCRTASTGPLATYPNMPDFIEMNILRNPNFSEYGDNLVVGALNVVHITSTRDDHAEWIYFDNLTAIVVSFLDLFEGWKGTFDTDDLETTFVRYVIHRDSEDSDYEDDHRYGDDIDTDFFEFWVAFRSKLDSELSDSDIGVDLKKRFDVCWADDEGDCPACQPDTCHPAYKTDLLCFEGSREVYDLEHKDTKKGQDNH